MTRFNPLDFGRVVLSILSAFAFSGAPIQPSFASGAATTAEIEDKVAKDADLDIAILDKPQADKLVSKAKLVGGTAATLGKMNPDLIFVVASPMVSEQPLPAKAFIDFLGTPDAKAVLKAKGVEPG